MTHPTEALIRQVSALEARLTLCEAAISALLAALTRVSPREAALAHVALKACAESVVQNSSLLATEDTDKRISQTANAFIDMTDPSKVK